MRACPWKSSGAWIAQSRCLLQHYLPMEWLRHQPVRLFGCRALAVWVAVAAALCGCEGSTEICDGDSQRQSW